MTMNKTSTITRHQNPSTNVEISVKQPNNTILNQNSIILIQTNNNNLTHPTRIKELEKNVIN